MIGKQWIALFGCLVNVALFPPCVIIFENKSDALSIKLLILRVHLAIQRGSENIDPQKIVDVHCLTNGAFGLYKDW